MVESNPPRRLNVHQAHGGGSGSLSLSLQIYAYIFIFIMHIYTAMYELLCMNLRILHAHP